MLLSIEHLSTDTYIYCQVFNFPMSTLYSMRPGFCLLHFCKDPSCKEYNPSKCVRDFCMSYISLLKWLHSLNFLQYFLYLTCPIDFVNQVPRFFLFLLYSSLHGTWVMVSPLVAPLQSFYFLDQEVFYSSATQGFPCHYLIPLHITAKITQYVRNKQILLPGMLCPLQHLHDLLLQSWCSHECFILIKLFFCPKHTYQTYFPLYETHLIFFFLFKSYSFSKIQLKSHRLCQSFLVLHNLIFSVLRLNLSS